MTTDQPLFQICPLKISSFGHDKSQVISILSLFWEKGWSLRLLHYLGCVQVGGHPGHPGRHRAVSISLHQVFHRSSTNISTKYISQLIFQKPYTTNYIFLNLKAILVPFWFRIILQDDDADNYVDDDVENIVEINSRWEHGEDQLVDR